LNDLTQEKAEFWEKFILRGLKNVDFVRGLEKATAYEPKDKFAKDIKEIFYEMAECEHEKHQALKHLYRTLGNLISKFVDRDEHYRMRVGALALRLKSLSIPSDVVAWSMAFWRRKDGLG